MNLFASKILSQLSLGDDGIYNSGFLTCDQEDEIKLRENVAARIYPNYLHEVCKHHSIAVMDREVKTFLQNKLIKAGGK